MLVPLKQAAFFGAVELLEQFFLLLTKFGRRVDKYLDDMSAAGLALHVRHTVARQLEVGATLRTGRDFHPYRSINCLDIDFSSKRGINH